MRYTSSTPIKVIVWSEMVKTRRYLKKKCFVIESYSCSSIRSNLSKAIRQAIFNCHFIHKRTSTKQNCPLKYWRQKRLIIFSQNLVISATIHGWKNLLLSGRSAKRSTLAPRKIYNVLHSLLVRLHFSFSIITKQKRPQKISPKKVLKTKKKLSKSPLDAKTSQSVK